MKKNLSLIAIIMVSASLFAGTIEKTFHFSNPQLSKSKEAVQITFENTFLNGVPGEPSLPYHAVSLILPPGESVSSFEFICENEIQIPGFYKISPQQPSHPLSEDGPFAFVKNEKIYATDISYPKKVNGTVTTEFLNGFGFALSTFTPVKYNPVTGSLSYYQSVTVKIKSKPGAIAQKAFLNLKTSPKKIQKVKNLAQNPEGVLMYPESKFNADDYELMIITPSQFENDFQDLIDLYLVRGIKTEVVTKEYIIANVTGQDVQEKIRNYIIQEYQQHNVDYVILGGDVEYIPYRGFYCYVQSGGGYTDNGIPADLYYSGLDGTWNDDNDNKWGEPGEDDLLPDIAVSRFPFSNITELNNLKHKSISYQDSPVLGEFTSPLLAGENLYSGPDTWGKDYLDLLIGTHDDNGYTTIGIPESNNIETLYEFDQSWSGNTLIAKINSGKQFVHHVGHANQTYVAHLSISDITNSNFSGANGIDHNYTFLQTHGCDCGSFDYNDCILEKMVTIENFAVAVIGNSRYGWFNEGQTEGPAAHLHREMVDALYHEKLNHLGAAFAEAKIQTAPWVTAPGQWEEGALRWNFYDINILGDAALSVLTDEPISINTTYESAIPIGVSSTNVTVMSNGAAMENFTCTVIKDGMIYGTGLTNASGTAQIDFDPVFENVGDAQLIVSGYNCLPTTYDITVVPNDGAYVVYNSFEINDAAGNNNGEPDFGETISLSVEIENVGTQTTSDLQITLTSLDNNITITDGFESLASIAGNTTINLTDAFSFDIGSNIPDQHIVSFDLQIEGGETWTSTFQITMNAPELVIGNLIIDDSQGNGDGILDPGETVDVIIQSSNLGHCACDNVSGALSSNSTYVNLLTSNVDLGTLDAGQSKQASFTIEVDAATPIGTGIDLLDILSSGDYTTQNVFYLIVGFIVEDFETGDFSAFSWDFGGNADWQITNQNPYEGTYCAQSGTISDGQLSELSIAMNVLADDEISFFRKVSSEAGYDYLRFYMDGVQKGEWAGEVSWGEETYAVTSGDHTFKWAYGKDGSVSNGSDKAWVDYIVFPGGSGAANPLSVNASGNPSIICAGETSQLMAYATGGSGTYIYAWEPTSGLNDPTISNPVATPFETTTYTVTVTDESSSVSDDVTITVNPTPATPVVTLQGDHVSSNVETGNQWYGSDGAIDGATGQDFYPTETDYYYAIVTNGSGCVSGQSNAVYFVFTGITTLSAGDFKVFPNPSNGTFTVSITGQNGKYKILVINVLDQVVYQSTSEINNNEKLQVDLSNQEKGVYFIKIKSSVSELIRKIMIQ
ncbi:MAG: T9SS type A sorting domain-containing protein [Chlorobi bacterium]|nr:T9SS type A sorting domain-containing protein [Chlorobiota bacterium]